MSGIRWLYISSKDKIFKVPHPKNSKFKAVNELAEQEVLKIMLYYKTKERKPHKLILVEFDRIVLDVEGAYEYGDDSARSLYNFFNFAFTTPETLAETEEPLRIPQYPIVPLEREKNALYDYLDQKIPTLAKDAPLIVENVISSLKKTYEENKNVVREANKARKKKV